LKLGARVVEMTSRVRLAFAAACPDATLIGRTGDRLMLLGGTEGAENHPLKHLLKSG
jgi:hypothetical protein